MTTSYFQGRNALVNIFSMYLGLWEGIRLRKQKAYETSSQKIDFIDNNIKKIKRGYGLASIEEYFNINPNKWINGLNKVIKELKGETPNLEKQVQYIEETIPPIQTILPKVPHY